MSRAILPGISVTFSHMTFYFLSYWSRLGSPIAATKGAADRPAPLEWFFKLGHDRRDILRLVPCSFVGSYSPANRSNHSCMFRGPRSEQLGEFKGLSHARLLLRVSLPGHRSEPSFQVQDTRDSPTTAGTGKRGMGQFYQSASTTCCQPPCLSCSTHFLAVTEYDHTMPQLRSAPGVARGEPERGPDLHRRRARSLVRRRLRRNGARPRVGPARCSPRP